MKHRALGGPFVYLQQEILEWVVSISLSKTEERRRKGREKKEARRTILHVSSFRNEKNEFQKESVACPSSCCRWVADTQPARGSRDFLNGGLSNTSHCD